MIDDNINVVNLGNKYVSSCVREFKKNHAAFVYGKKDGEGHFVQQNGNSVFKTSQRIGKLNPKYVEMIQNLKLQEEDQEDMEIFA